MIFTNPTSNYLYFLYSMYNSNTCSRDKYPQATKLHSSVPGVIGLLIFHFTTDLESHIRLTTTSKVHFVAFKI